jgi:hypothetical protein
VFGEPVDRLDGRGCGELDFDALVDLDSANADDNRREAGFDDRLDDAANHVFPAH